jgi:hypothetical protein
VLQDCLGTTEAQGGDAGGMLDVQSATEMKIEWKDIYFGREKSTLCESSSWSAMRYHDFAGHCAETPHAAILSRIDLGTV